MLYLKNHQMYKHPIQQLLFIIGIFFTFGVNAINQCLTDADCKKFNTDVDTHVCIRWDGMTSYVCYLETEAYCKADSDCVALANEDTDLKFCYVPPWLTNQKDTTKKQCFTTHGESGPCVLDNHCGSNLYCVDNLCSKTKANKTESSTSTNKPSSSSTPINSIYFDDDIEEKKKPIEIIGLPLWAFILIVTVPIIFIIAVIWGLVIGRKSYLEEETRRKDEQVLKNQRAQDAKYIKSNSNSNIQSEEDLNKGELLKNYIGSNNNINGTTLSTSSNNTCVACPDSALNTKKAKSFKDSSTLLDMSNVNLPNSAALTTATTATTTSGMNTKLKKSNPNLRGELNNMAPKPVKKPKPFKTTSSEYSDTNSHKGLLSNSSSNLAGFNATDSGIYSNYFGNTGMGSTVSSAYFNMGNNPMPMTTAAAAATTNDPMMNNYYYQQMVAAQAQLQAYQNTAQQNLMAPAYYTNMNMNAGMSAMDMMQYQNQYAAAVAGMDMNNYYAAANSMGMPNAGYPMTTSSSSESLSSINQKQKRKQSSKPK